ncbi:MAG TPA: hypothetical protein VMU01_04200 [Rhizomicrobium sp.]|nr:hypothetical protein [Rhizomicrobium sp.]
MKTAPRTNAKLAQLTGLIVTSIVVFGTDLDVLIAVPLGILAGALATFFMALGDRQTEKVRDR